MLPWFVLFTQLTAASSQSPPATCLPAGISLDDVIDPQIGNGAS